ncbi:MAG: hypothetical protein IGS23_01680 [Rivularia sp. T60_A2020_040]|nr:hypothetical protein [Rivularia sp. T60_A2020_040]
MSSFKTKDLPKNLLTAMTDHNLADGEILFDQNEVANAIFVVDYSFAIAIDSYPKPAKKNARGLIPRAKLQLNFTTHNHTKLVRSITMLNKFHQNGVLVRTFI